jgi:hypothetical protein
MHLPKPISAVFTILALAACSEAPPEFEPITLAVPAAGPAKGPRISGNNETGLVLSWMEEGESGAALHYSRFVDGQWSPAATVVEGVDMFVNWADMASVQPIGKDHLAAHWLEMSANLTYSYDVVFSQSADGGATWTEPLRPHDDGTPTEHGFVSMWPDVNGTGLIWLDGRKTANEATDDPTATGMTLRAATVDHESIIRKEQLVDELICDCCQTDIAVAASGPVAVYRDRSINEIRDISVSRHIDGRWQPASPIAADNWQIPGCPVNGPSIVADGNFVAAAWFTAAGGRPVVKLALSNDSGASFSEPIEVATGKVQGRVGIVYLGDGNVAVSWLQSGAEGGHEVRTRRYTATGTAGTPRLVTADAGGFSVPQIARSGDDLVFVWTETADSSSHLRSAKVAAAAL